VEEVSLAKGLKDNTCITNYEYILYYSPKKLKYVTRRARLINVKVLGDNGNFLGNERAFRVNLIL